MRTGKFCRGPVQRSTSRAQAVHVGGSAAAGRGQVHGDREARTVGAGVDDGVGADLGPHATVTVGDLDADVEVGAGVGATASAGGGFEHDAADAGGDVGGLHDAGVVEGAGVHEVTCEGVLLGTGRERPSAASIRSRMRRTHMPPASMVRL